MCHMSHVCVCHRTRSHEGGAMYVCVIGVIYICVI